MDIFKYKIVFFRLNFICRQKFCWLQRKYSIWHSSEVIMIIKIISLFNHELCIQHCVSPILYQWELLIMLDNAYFVLNKSCLNPFMFIYSLQLEKPALTRLSLHSSCLCLYISYFSLYLACFRLYLACFRLYLACFSLYLA